MCVTLFIETFFVLYRISFQEYMCHLVYYYSTCFRNIHLNCVFKHMIKVYLLVTTRLPSFVNPYSISGKVDVRGGVYVRDLVGVGGISYVNKTHKRLA